MARKRAMKAVTALDRGFIAICATRGSTVGSKLSLRSNERPMTSAASVSESLTATSAPIV